MSNPELTVLSFGGGQDSTAILYKLAFDSEFRQRYAPGRLLVVMSDTGDEHPRTYAHVEKIERFCREQRIEFKFLRKVDGYHLDKWPSLREFYERTNTVGSKAFPKTCTDKLKLRPVYYYIAAWLTKHYGVPVARHVAFNKFCEQHGRVRVLIGFAAGEGTRIADQSKHSKKWWRETLEFQYPLLDLDMDREACQEYIRSEGREVPPPSNCMLCPFMSKIELLWLHRHHRSDFEQWVRIEARKIEANLHMGDKNLGVWGKKLLPQILAEAQAEHGHMTDAELDEYKMSHGHCVKSKF